MKTVKINTRKMAADSFDSLLKLATAVRVFALNQNQETYDNMIDALNSSEIYMETLHEEVMSDLEAAKSAVRA